MARAEATLRDLIDGYRLFLGREPESAEVMVSHLSSAPSAWEIVERLHGSQEAQRRAESHAMGRISAEQDARGVELDASAEQMERLLAHVEQVWSAYGREEAFFSVLTDPRYLKERLGVDDLAAFYASGEAEADRVAETLRRNRVEPDPSWRVLELGCGVGRVSAALARRYAGFRGVDISAEHLALARRHFAESGEMTGEFQLLSEALRDERPFDFFFSIIVLQHNPPPIIRRLLDVFLAQVRPGGCAYFQVPAHLHGYRFSTSTYLAGEGWRETMEMHPLPQHEVLDLLTRHGFQPLEVRPDSLVGDLGFSYTYIARKRG